MEQQLQFLTNGDLTAIVKNGWTIFELLQEDKVLTILFLFNV